MKSNLKIPRIVWFLVALLVSGVILVELGRVTENTNPSSTSELPSGTRMFAELLRANGYTVRSSPSLVMIPERDEVAIAMWTYSMNQFMGEPEFGADNTAFAKRIMAKGRTFIAIPIAPDFRKQSLESAGKSKDVTGPGEVTLTVTESPWANDAADEVLEYDVQTELDYLWWDASTGVVQYVVNESQTFFEITNGIAATNRFIGKHDNAEYLLRVVDQAARGKRKVVFLHAFHGDVREPSITEILGPWAQGSLNQVLILFLASIFIFGIRFGLNATKSRRQSGTRELVDSYADIMQRAKAASLASDQVIRAMQLRLLLYLKLPLGVEDEVIQKHVPKEVWFAFVQARDAKGMDAPLDVQLAAVKELEKRVTEFIGTEIRGSSTMRRRNRRMS